MRAGRAAIAAATAVLLAGAACSSKHAGTADAAGPDGPDADLPDASAVGFPNPIVIGPANGTLALPFAAAITGDGMKDIGHVAIAGDVGDIALDGTSVSAFTYASIPFAPFTLYQGMAVGPTRWDVFWAYCENGALDDVYDESVDGPPLFFETATGACSATTMQTTPLVTFGAAQVAPPAPVGGFVVTGDRIAIHADGTGTVTLDGAALPLVVFGHVDCTTGCGTPGWYELHSLVWEASHQRAIFVIVYLVEGATQAELAYARSLPDLADPIGTTNLPATWTKIGQAVREQASPPRFGVPPPSLRAR